jgi:hypothetical protein
MNVITRDDTLHDVEYVTKHEAQMEIDAANHRGMIAAATLRNEITAMQEAMKDAQSAISAFLGFHSDKLTLPQMRSLADTMSKLQPFLK